MPSVGNETIASAPPPWKLKGSLYVLPFFSSASAPVPRDIAFAPLEAASPSFTTLEQSGKFKGSLGYIQIVCYTESPVGPYDELLVIPGYYTAPDKLGRKGQYLRITGIWVSQKETCMNGRKNWNIPKHLARFKFTKLKPGSTLPLKVEVFPWQDADDPAKATTQPFFTTVIHAARFSLPMRFKSTWQHYLGFPTALLQPPLPVGQPAEVEVGTEDWMLTSSLIASKKCRLVWFDMKQAVPESTSQDTASQKSDRAPNWWPGFARWRIGIGCTETGFDFGHPEVIKG